MADTPTSVDGDLRLDRVGSVAHVVLNRAAVHNAFNDALIASLTTAFLELDRDRSVRVVVLRGEGRSFCAGADLGWMGSMVQYDEADNKRDSLELAGMYETIDRCSKPVIAQVQGAAIGGGCGLACVSDIVVCGPRARFALSEVRLGLAPAVIAPYVVRKIGSSQARWLFLTGERIGPQRAFEIGMAHKLVDEEAALDKAVETVIQDLLRGGPAAQAACKQLARQADRWVNPAERTAGIIAGLRVGVEGQEGMLAFLEKRSPAWQGEGES